jgi:hypothetical protein
MSPGCWYCCKGSQMKVTADPEGRRRLSESTSISPPSIYIRTLHSPMYIHWTVKRSRVEEGHFLRQVRKGRRRRGKQDYGQKKKKKKKQKEKRNRIGGGGGPKLSQIYTMYHRRREKEQRPSLRKSFLNLGLLSHSRSPLSPFSGFRLTTIQFQILPPQFPQIQIG